MSSPEKVVLITTQGREILATPIGPGQIRNDRTYAVDKLHNANLIFELKKPLQPGEGWQIREK